MEDQPHPVPLDYQPPGRRESRLTRFFNWYRRAIDVRLHVLLGIGWLSALWPWLVRGDLAPFYSLFGLVAGIVVAWTARRHLSVRVVARRIAIGAAIVFLLFTQIGFWSCPHAGYLRIGPFGLTYSGQSCGNIQYSKYFDDSLIARTLNNVWHEPDRGN